MKVRISLFWRFIGILSIVFFIQSFFQNAYAEMDTKAFLRTISQLKRIQKKRLKSVI